MNESSGLFYQKSARETFAALIGRVTNTKNVLKAVIYIYDL